MIRTLRLIALGLLLFPALALAADAPPTVILLSLDGVRHDALDPDAGPDLPALERMAREGARAESLVPVFPSNTFPGHVSLATGTYADRHGIVGNRFHDAGRARTLGPDAAEFDYANDASWIQAEPLWVAAERQGVPTATFFWVGSETDWNGVGARHRRAPFSSSVPESEKVDQILAWLALPPPERPRLILSWWHGADSAGHRHGPDSPEARRQLAGQDAELARLLAALDAREAWATTTLLVVSDHGMIEVDESLDVLAPLRNAGLSTEGIRVVTGGSFASLFLPDPSPAPADKIARLLAQVPGIRAWPRAGLPPALRYAHPTRTGDVVALTDPPRFFGPPGRGGRLDAVGFRVSRLLGRSRGSHGYDPERVPDRAMDGVFLALGRGVAPGHRPGRARAIDVAATVAGLLGIEPPAASEGRPIPLAP